MPSLLSYRLTAATAVGALLLVTAACGRQSNVSSHGSNSGAMNAGAGGGTAVAAKGSAFYGKLQSPLSSKTSKDGDTFVLASTAATKNAQLQGASIDGHVENVHPAGMARKPTMTLVFDDVRLADGTKAPVDGQLVSLNAFRAKTHRLRTIGMMMGGALAGHEVAAHTGRKHGGLIGAVGGYALSQQMKTDFNVPAGTVLQVRFLEPVTAPSK